jgi:malate dehydrogenase
MPIRVDADGRWDVVPGVKLDEFSQGKVDATIQELREEREAVAELI